tara:strand:+ start:9717 stop:10187 length:471 start_codon:yes stop_codon:yes gene_type:complete
MKKNKRLTLEFKEEQGVLFIYCNALGILYLKETLEELSKMEAPEDFHLMSPEWGGEELTEETVDGLLIKHLKPTLWDEDVCADRLISFELIKERETVQMHCNKEGILYVIQLLATLLDEPKTNLLELKMPSKGGNELTQEDESDEVIQEVRLILKS